MLEVLAALFALVSAYYALQMAYSLFIEVRSYCWEHNPMIFSAEGPDPHPKRVKLRNILIPGSGFLIHGAIAVGIFLWLWKS